MKRYIRSATDAQAEGQAIAELKSYTDDFMTRRFIPQIIAFMQSEKADIDMNTALQIAEATDYVGYELYSATGIEPDIRFGYPRFRGAYISLLITLPQSTIDAFHMSYWDNLKYGRAIFRDEITLEDIKTRQSWNTKSEHILNMFGKTLKKCYKKYLERIEPISPTQYAQLYINTTNEVHFITNYIADPTQFIQYCNNQLSRIYNNHIRRNN